MEQPIVFSAQPDGTSINDTLCTFGPVSGTWGTLTVFDVRDLNHNTFFRGTLLSSVAPRSGQLLILPPGSVTITTDIPVSDVPVPAQVYIVPLNSSVFYFDGELVGGFTPFSPGAPVPAQIYTEPRNSSVFYFDGELTGGFTPTPSEFQPSLRFNDRRNSGLLMFRGQPSGEFIFPTPPPSTPAAQVFTEPTNSSLEYFDGQLSGAAFTPT